ncbi:MAG: hypothetical protein OER90_19425, partial [Gemmatimonadota bacterium]|nr:hypothetical protein [Gemmatimonadota bacterium]
MAVPRRHRVGYADPKSNAQGTAPIPQRGSVTLRERLIVYGVRKLAVHNSTWRGNLVPCPIVRHDGSPQSPHTSTAI